MGEEILAAVIGGNEPESLRVIEPFHDTSGHAYSIPDLMRCRSVARFRARFSRKELTTTAPAAVRRREDHVSATRDLRAGE
jgi:hypothetical protein